MSALANCVNLRTLHVVVLLSVFCCFPTATSETGLAFSAVASTSAAWTVPAAGTALGIFAERLSLAGAKISAFADEAATRGACVSMQPVVDALFGFTPHATQSYACAFRIARGSAASAAVIRLLG